jgi:DNA polymerase
VKIEDYTLLTLDFETYYGRGYSLGRSDTNTIDYICDDKFKIQCVGVKVDDEDVEIFREDEMAEFEQFLLDLTRSGEPIALVCHNTAFDGIILHHHFNWHPDYYVDTMSMSKGMFVGASASLKALSKRLWSADSGKRKGDELALSKDIYDLPRELMDIIANYCLQDVTLTYEAFKVMYEHFPEDELYLIHANIRMFCEPWLRVDTEIIQEEIEAQVTEKRAAYKKAGVPLTVLSSNQKFGIYLETRGYELPAKENAKGEWIAALGQKDWEFLKFMAAHPELADVFAARKYAKSNIQESRARRFLSTAKKFNGFMPVPLKYYGAHTGRYSGGEALNLQNLPRYNDKDDTTGRLRRSLCAPDGYSVIVSDLSNIEARVLAWISGNTTLIDLYNQGGDPYLLMASLIYQFDYAEALEIRRKPTDDNPNPIFDGKFRKSQRDVGKVAVLGLGFGMGANKFWVTMNTGPMGMDPIPTTIDEAKHIVGLYREANFPVVDYWDRCDEIINQMLQGNVGLKFGPLEIHNNNIILPNNMALQYPNLCMKEDIKGHSFQYSPELNQYGELKTRKYLWGGTLTENIVQALARIIITEQAIGIEKHLDDTYGLDQARLVHMVHDELIVVGPEQYAEDIYKSMIAIMSTPPSWALDLPLTSEGGWANNYIK